MFFVCLLLFFFFKQKTAYEMRISDWSSDVCSSDLEAHRVERRHRLITARGPRLAAIEQRQLDILERARARQQVEALKHEAEILAPQQRALIAVEPFDMVPAEQIGRAHV